MINFAMQWYEKDIRLMMQSLNFKFKEVYNPSLKPLTNNVTKTKFLGHPQEMHIAALFVKVLSIRLITIKLN